jgi:MFS family permease
MIASRHDVLALFRGCLLATALTFGIWSAAQGDVLVLWTFAVLFGLAYGGSVGLTGAVVARLFGVQQLGSALGLILTAGGVGSLIGPPVAGTIIDTAGYTTAIAVSAALSFAAWVVARELGTSEESRPQELVAGSAQG